MNKMLIVLYYCLILAPVEYRWFLLPDVVGGHVAGLHAAVLHPPPVLAVVDQDQPLVPPHVELLDQSALSILVSDQSESSITWLPCAV